MEYHSDTEAFLLWCPGFLGASDEPFSYVYADRPVAERAKLYASECFPQWAKAMRIDRVPLLIGTSDLRGF